MSKFSTEEIDTVRKFVLKLRGYPHLVHSPELAFFKQYLVSLRAKLPSEKPVDEEESDQEAEQEAPAQEKTEQPAEDASESKQEQDDEVFSVPEPVLDTQRPEEEQTIIDEFGSVNEEEEAKNVQGTGVEQVIPEAGKDVSEEDIDAASQAKQAGVADLEKQDYSSALKHFSEAITKNPNSALLYAARADVYLRLRCPRAALKDTEAALKINPDSAKNIRYQGQALLLLSQFQKAYEALARAQSIDYSDDEAATKKLKNLKKIVDGEKKRRAVYENEHQEWLKKKIQHQRAMYEKQKQREEEERNKFGGEDDDVDYEKMFGKMGGMPGMGGMGGMPGMGGMGGMPGMGGLGGMPGMGGMGGMPGMGGLGGMGGMGGGMPAGMDQLFSDPDIMAAMQNPKFMEAMQKMMKDPSYVPEDPQVRRAMEKLSKNAAQQAKQHA